MVAPVVTVTLVELKYEVTPTALIAVTAAVLQAVTV